MARRIYDISVEISPRMVVWCDDPSVKLDQVLNIHKGDEINLTRLEMSLHNGTHIDAPRHYLENGLTVDSFSLDTLIGAAQVIQIENSIMMISEEILKKSNIMPGIQRLLIKTGNSRFWSEKRDQFHEDYCGVTTGGSKYLVEQGIRLVGIDYLSISPMVDLDGPHKELMKNNVIILESLDLSKVEPGFYELYCLPLKIGKVEGAPVRAILIQN
jgi:arylformamidase